MQALCILVLVIALCLLNIRGQSSDECATSISNYYVNTREQIFSQGTKVILSALPGTSNSTENGSQSTYKRLLELLQLADTSERQDSFNQAFSEIIQASTSFCTRNSNSFLSAVNVSQLLNQLQQGLDAESEGIRELYGQVLCISSKFNNSEITLFLSSLSIEDQAKIFGLQQQPLTLAFVVDDTGSMSEEIAAVRAIINSFISSNSSAVTDYILTTFNDPGVGTPAKYSATSATELAQLGTAVNVITANGGGDCPELGMVGILNGLSLSSQGGSVIVLTDASAKDASRTDEVIQAAFELGACVNFIFSREGCGTGFSNYRRVSQATKGSNFNDLISFNTLANQTQKTGLRLCVEDTGESTFNETVNPDGTIKRCKVIEVSSLSESLSFSFNPLSESAAITLSDPDRNLTFNETITSLEILNIPESSFKSGSWMVCILSGEAEIRQTQNIRFDLAVEFLEFDELSEVYYTAAQPPHTREEVTVLLFSSRINDLSSSMNQTLQLINGDGIVVMEVELSLCNGYLQGKYLLPTVEYRLVFYGFDSDNKPLIIALRSTYPPGPMPVSCTPSCQNGGTCDEGNTCICPTGFVGSDCSEEVVCLPSCVNGLCTNHNVCMCHFGYTGQACETQEYGDCIVNQCNNGGTCRQVLTTKEIICTCTEQYTGSYCEQVKCEVTLVTYEVEYAYIIGGFDINFQLSDLCQISDSDNVTCTINEESIEATSSDNKRFSCQVPSLEKTGEHVFQIEGQTASNGGFTYQNSIMIRGCIKSINPVFGHMFGGTPVTVELEQYCLNNTDTLVCTFDSTDSVAVKIIQDGSFVCPVPMFPSVGRILLRIKGTTSWEAMFTKYFNFYLTPPYNSHEVEIEGSNSKLGFEIYLQSTFTIRWLQKILPNDDTSYDLEIEFYFLNLRDGEWNVFTAYQAVENTGEYTDGRVKDLQTEIINYHLKGGIPFKINSIIPFIVNVRVSNTSFSKWSGVYFFGAINKRDSLGNRCTIPKIDTSLLPPCPLYERQALLAGSGFKKEDRISIQTNSDSYQSMYVQSIHSIKSMDVKSCFVEENIESRSLVQQCCYGLDGNLLLNAGRPNVGTPLYETQTMLVTNIENTILPLLYCCKVGTGKVARCEDYVATFKSNNGSGYMQPQPAYLYGDPHIVTLDGHSYTFNGKGEFTLVEHLNGSFIVQGRMEQAVNSNGTILPATVFTAIAVQTNVSDVIQLEVNGSDVVVRIQKEVVNVVPMVVEEFAGGSIQKSNNTYIITLDGGYVIEVKGSSDILSTIKIVLPNSLRGLVQGLLGNYNGNSSDDLLPRNSTEHLSINTTLEDIHKEFGVSWILTSGINSLFYYTEGMDWNDFHDPSFIPVFQTNFTDPELQAKAEDLCNEDIACLFDVAATGSLDVGMETLGSSREVNEIMEAAIPMVCDPPCENGVCIAEDTCACGIGFSGRYCSESDFIECDNNPCQNFATCTQHILAQFCECPRDFNGTLCEVFIGDNTTTTIPVVDTGAIIGGAIGGVLGGIIVILIITLAVAVAISRKKSSKKNIAVTQGRKGDETLMSPHEMITKNADQAI